MNTIVQAMRGVYGRKKLGESTEREEEMEGDWKGGQVLSQHQFHHFCTKQTPKMSSGGTVTTATLNPPCTFTWSDRMSVLNNWPFQGLRL